MRMLMKKRLLSAFFAMIIMVGIVSAAPASAAAAGGPELPPAVNAAWLAARPSDRFDPDIALVAAYINERKSYFENDYFAFQFEDEPEGKFFGLQTLHIGHTTEGGSALVVEGLLVRL